MTAAAPKICVVGSANIDLTFQTPRLPRPGETLAGHTFQVGCGGKGANQAVMAARMGASVSLVAKIGDDVFGEQNMRNLRDHGIDTTHVSIDPERPSGVAAIIVDESAQNSILVISGANGGLSPRDIQEAAATVQSAAVVLCQLEVPLETTLETFRLARAAGVRTVLNPAPALPLPDELLELTDLCVPNETEIEILANRKAGTLEETESAARTLLQLGPQAVIVTLGSRGALVVIADTARHIPPLPVQAVDPTGAGDAFIGSLAVFLAEGSRLLEAAVNANAVAALSVTRPGAQASFPSRAEVEEWLSKR